MAPSPAIETRGLSKRYGRRLALDGLNLTVEAGQIFGFLGPNGAGKTTTIRLLMGLLRPTAGSAALFGRSSGSPQARADGHVGALVEGPAFYEYLPARENLRIYARLSGGASAQEIDRALALVGLQGRDRDKVRAYSHGMRQRLGLAQALLPMPRLLVVDEPAIGLDPQGLADIRALLIGLSHEHGITVFLSSHLLHEVEQICTHVGVVVPGKLVAVGPVGELLSQHDAPVTFRVTEPERAAEILRGAAGVVSAIQRTAALDVLCPRDAIPDLNELLVSRGVRVYAIEPQTPTLEQFYMRLTSVTGVTGARAEGEVTA